MPQYDELQFQMQQADKRQRAKIEADFVEQIKAEERNRIKLAITALSRILPAGRPSSGIWSDWEANVKLAEAYNHCLNDVLVVIEDDAEKGLT